LADRCHFSTFGEGGPTFDSGKDRMFFFGDYQRWTDRQLGSGFTLNGAPTEAGRAILQSAVGNRPQVAALLQFLPAGASNGQTRSFTANGQTLLFRSAILPVLRLSNLIRIKVQSELIVDSATKIFCTVVIVLTTTRRSGGGQVTPPGLTTIVPQKTKAATIV
jgi:hypothetical protein